MTQPEFTAFVTANPDFTATGFGIDQGYIVGTKEYQARWASERAYLFTLYPQCKYCIEWISNDPKFLNKKDQFGKKMNSKALKGVVEQWLRAQEVHDHYIPQGAFLIAALSEGFVIDKLYKGGPNVFLKKK